MLESFAVKLRIPTVDYYYWTPLLIGVARGGHGSPTVTQLCPTIKTFFFKYKLYIDYYKFFITYLRVVALAHTGWLANEMWLIRCMPRDLIIYSSVTFAREFQWDPPLLLYH